MSLRGYHNSTSMLVGTVSFLVVRIGLSYWALPATGVRGILTQEAIDTEQAVTEAHSTGRSGTVFGVSPHPRSNGHLHRCRYAGYCKADAGSIRQSIERDIESLGSVTIGGNDVTIVALQRLGSAIQDTVTRYKL